jgi:hypothetical protein
VLKIVFVAGPYNAKTDTDKRWNIIKAIQVAEQLIAAGHMPIVPHTNTQYMGGLASEKFFYEGYETVLKKCDAIALVPGWEHSKGARRELKLAQLLKMEVMEFEEVRGRMQLKREKKVREVKSEPEQATVPNPQLPIDFNWEQKPLANGSVIRTVLSTNAGEAK